MAFEQGFRTRPQRDENAPRRVRGGIKCKAKQWPPDDLSWLGKSWFSLFEQGAPGDELREGIDYAMRGQTRRIEVLPARVLAAVQGHKSSPNDVEIDIEPLPHEMWEKLIEALVDDPPIAARLLAGEMPPGVDQVFAACGASLLPSSPTSIRVRHSYAEASGINRYAVCAAALVTEMLDHEPLLAFTIQGMPAEELVERLRQRRSATSAGGRVAQLFGLGRPDAARAQEPLEAAADTFWDVGEQLEHLDTAPRRPEVPHALLRRLGPSPFADSKFPLVGLLATCYDMISERALNGPSPEPAHDPAEPDPRGPSEEADAASPPADTTAKSAAEVTAARIAARKAAKPKAKARKSGT
ncbi:MAG: hypothetical protein AAGI30_00570 [Planctomycetota bacterium]